ncbi:lipase family protein [Amycolatopsis anabasis]|uniref:lipase family protein n=1 Tax=Amycolatopsis anabasis TaxID=1840409 RepID=UPI00131C1D12|nr:lipase family protein [Amycolatopsis anabasis]
MFSPARNRRGRRLGTLALALVAGVGLTCAPAAATAPPPPQEDAFYQPPAGYETTAPGTILRTREVQLAAFSVLPQKVQAWQLLYRTTDRNGAADATATTVVLPWGAKPDRSRPLLSYQVAQDSTAPQCVPSYALRQGVGNEGIVTQAELLLIDAAVQQGWAVSIPDHEGRKGLLAAPREPGYLALDGVRAAENFAPLGLNGKDTKVGLWGYSGGALASAWTAEMQPAYAPELNIAGAALGGTVANAGDLAGRTNGGPAAGLFGLAIASLRKAYPQIDAVIEKYVNAEGRELLDFAATHCTAEVSARMAFQDISKYSSIPLEEMLKLPEVRPVLEEIKLGKHAPTAPLYVYHAVHDELPAIADTDALVAGYCAAGDSVTYKRDLLSEHVSLTITGAADALNWLKQRLGGAPAPRGCTKETVLSTLASPTALATFGSVLFNDLLALLGQPIGPRDLA